MIQDLLMWAKSKGVQINGIQPSSLPGRGIGFVATGDLQEGEVLMDIPIEAIRSLHTVPEAILHRVSSDISIQGLLAADLATDGDSIVWIKSAPPWTEFEANFPYMWPKELQTLLPGEARHILAQQQSKFQRDWKAFTRGFPGIGIREYLRAWFVVGTRAFYYETPKMLLYPQHDRLALLPVADLFNHATAGCVVSFSSDSYTITADRPYRKGDEVLTSYGRHSNDFLLAEYGFLLRNNQWDRVCLDDVILPRLHAKQKCELKDKGLLGGYMLSASSQECEDTTIALRLLCCEEAYWQNWIDGEEDAENTKAKASKLLSNVLSEFQDHIEEVQKNIRLLQIGNGFQREILSQRWKQIEAIVRQVLLTKSL